MTEKECPVMGVAGDPHNPTYYGFNAVEYAALELRVPMSGNPWLDDMIRAANWREAVLRFASAAGEDSTRSRIEGGIAFADALMAELETKGGE